MFRNYLKTAWRNLMKNKTFSLINVAGLSIGMAVCLLILQYVNFELSYDQFNKNAKDLYRVYNDRYQNGKLIQHGTITYSAIGKAMKDDYPEVLDHARVEPFGKVIISYQDKKIGEQEVLAVDNSFLTMFSYHLVAGDPNTALKQPYSAILSESSAKKIFGEKGNQFESLLGKAFIMGTDSIPYKVTGICKNVSENSHLQFDMLASYTSMLAGPHPYKEANYDFTDSDFWHYIQLKHGADYKKINARLEEFSKRHFQGNKVSGSVEKFYLQPLLKAHLYSDFEYEIGKTGSSTVVWGLLIIASLIMTIAWVNYVNLATAKSMERAKEVGVRKVAGANKPQLIRQFLVESLIINFIALFTALLTVLLVQNGFNSLVQHSLSISHLFLHSGGAINVTLIFLSLMVAGIFISGFYPAFILSSFRPIVVLKGKYLGSKKGIFLRKGLVIGQFAVTVTLIIGSFVVYRQVKFVNEQNLGYNLSQMLIVKPPVLTSWDSSFIYRETSFINELKQLSHIKGAAASGQVPGSELGRTFNVHRADINSSDHFTMRNLGVDHNFIDVYGITLLAGRNFTPLDYNYDWEKLQHIIINESAVKMLGYSSINKALGKSIMISNRKWEVIGVIHDFHQKSLRYPLEPTALFPSYTGSNNPISVKVDVRNLSSTLTPIKQKYDFFFPGNLFDYYFIDEKFNEQYQDDRLFGRVFGLFAGFAIFIACLGLLGLSLFATTQRTKEIGVRKVLGASIGQIVFLLSKDFVRLIFYAFIIASPLAWLLMHNWLQNFAYRINISWWIFFAAGFLALIIALATISFQSIKAALANPAKSLRTE